MLIQFKVKILSLATHWSRVYVFFALSCGGTLRTQLTNGLVLRLVFVLRFLSPLRSVLEVSGMVDFQGVQQLQRVIQVSKTMALAYSSHNSSPGFPNYKFMYAAKLPETVGETFFVNNYHITY